MKKAFTMLELIFVIVVIGILAAVIVPNTKRNPVQEAAVQIASHLKYTQHLAMTDDRYDSSDFDWHKERWQLVFSSSIYTGGADVWAYTIFSDRIGASTGDVDEGEVAKNPEDSTQLMTGGYAVEDELYYGKDDFRGMKSLNIGKTYGIIAVTFSNSCNGTGNPSTRISFDHLGRPFQGDQKSMTGPYSAGTQRLITAQCKIRISDGSENVDINIEPETGYVSLDFDP